MMTLVANARISSGEGNETRSVHILMDGDTFRQVIPASDPLPRCRNVIDASGLIAVPGGIDAHVHFNTPGYTEHEDFILGSMSAAAGGITCVVDMPDTSVPPVTDRAGLYAKLKAIGEMSVIDFALWGGVSGNSFRAGAWRSQMKTLKHEGVVGVKCYMLSSMRTFEHLLPLELLEVMRRAGEIGQLVAIHAEDRERAQKLTAGMATSGKRDAAAYYESRKDPVEADGIRQAARIAKETACQLHIVHVGSAAGAKAALEMRAKGALITMETCPHYLAFSHDQMEERGSVLKTSPVIKTRQDAEALWGHLISGDIAYLASDHAPCRPEEKATGSIWTDYSGISGTQLLMPFAISEGYSKGRITLARLVEITSSAAAARLGLGDRKGAIAPGMDADLALFDPKRKWTVRGGEFLSKGKQTPFEGAEFTGRIVRTICRGSTVFEEGRGVTAQPGYGNFVRRR
ncbi:MAG: allantoinase AllB [Proteobacteria bacterium]|nr:allantoinase AllB [Pseudomonadota bacterium]